MWNSVSKNTEINKLFKPAILHLSMVEETETPESEAESSAEGEAAVEEKAAGLEETGK